MGVFSPSGPRMTKFSIHLAPSVLLLQRSCDEVWKLVWYLKSMCFMVKKDKFYFLFSVQSFWSIQSIQYFYFSVVIASVTYALKVLRKELVLDFPDLNLQICFPLQCLKNIFLTVIFFVYFSKTIGLQRWVSPIFSHKRPCRTYPGILMYQAGRYYVGFLYGDYILFSKFSKNFLVFNVKDRFYDSLRISWWELPRRCHCIVHSLVFGGIA